jgi:hypothetical protein
MSLCLQHKTPTLTHTHATADKASMQRKSLCGDGGDGRQATTTATAQRAPLPAPASAPHVHQAAARVGQSAAQLLHTAPLR